MMKRSKKAMSAMFAMLIAIVIVTVIIILIIIIFKKIADASEESALRSRCQASVAAYARLKDIPFGEATTGEADIRCPTQYITIEDTTPKDMRRQVANQMVDCWSNFGAGKLRLFTADDEKFCVICSVLEFEDESEKLTGLSSFLMTERAPVIQDKKRPTYYEYLTGVQTNPEIVDQVKSSVDLNYLDGSKRYAVMFTFYKESYWSKLKSALYGALTGAVAGTVVVLGVGVGLFLAVGTVGIGAPVSALIVSGSAALGAYIAAETSESDSWTTEGADWDANVILAEYNAAGLEALGCTALPVSQVDERFR
jgi:hypothetical protein